MKFTRFGVLSPQKQVSYGKDSFHAAPCKKGFYAFPHPYVEKFLLGATDNPTNSSYKSSWLKDDDGNHILYKDVEQDYDYKNNIYNYTSEFKKFLKKRKIKETDLSHTYKDGIENSVMIYFKKPHIFEFDGVIWHHLYDVLKMSPMSSDWIKTDIETYKKALDLERHNNKTNFLREAHKQGWIDDNDSWIRGSDGLNLYVKDHLEVFIERIK